MRKIIIEIDDKQYEDAINDTEWDTLSLGVYLKEKVKNGKPLQTELEEIKEKIEWEAKGQSGAFIKAYKVFDIIDNYISELKGENNE